MHVGCQAILHLGLLTWRRLSGATWCLIPGEISGALWAAVANIGIRISFALLGVLDTQETSQSISSVLLAFDLFTAALDVPPRDKLSSLSCHCHRQFGQVSE
jgi:hypothetical protein